jgi:hypothetical protein
VQLGSLVALAMLVSSGSALVLLPAVVARMRPRFLCAEVRAVTAPAPTPAPSRAAEDAHVAAGA